ncbi:Extracellular metalloprotease [Picochlorum sp. SENEW3]|nr:Extracellular metalloprotease [Picochlorum sp. SENEW3]WPT15929.1 Extracellular metalloprotease [Picochlorum sp. SENEW3]
MKKRVTNIFTLLCVTLTLVVTAVGGQEGADWSCGTQSTNEAVQSILSAQRQVYGRAMHEISNSTERTLATSRASFPRDVKIKVRVVNCAGNAFKGFTRSLRKMNDGFDATKIGFRLDKVVECPGNEARQLDKHCTDAFSKNNKCPDVLRSISRRVGYDRGILIIVIDIPAYRVLGLADLGLMPKDPWVMVQATTLPDVSRTVSKSVQIENNGYTLIHEVGHAFGLLHTFENGCKSPGDYIPDTPYQSTALSRTPEFLRTLQCCVLHPTNQCAPPSTCENESGNNFDNFMDYSPDSCKKRFTPDQIAVMHATLLARRPEWLKKSKKKKSLRDIAVSEEVGETSKTIQGAFIRSEDNNVDLEHVQGCPVDSLWKNGYKRGGPGVLGQPQHAAYHLDIPSSSSTLQISQCQSSGEEATVSLTYLECEEGSVCTCQMLQCGPETESELKMKTSRVLGEGQGKDRYLIVSNTARLGDNVTFSLDARVDLDQTQSPQNVSTPSPVKKTKQCLYSGSYKIYVPRGACKYKYLSTRADCGATTVRLRSRKQLKNAMSAAYWNIQRNSSMDKQMSNSSTLRNHGRTNCPSKYLAAPKSSPSIGGKTWTWRIIPVSNKSCKKVRLVVDNGLQKNQYVSVSQTCGLVFSKSKASSQIFGVKDRDGKVPKPVLM